jgi:hypothetical protein
MQNIRITYVPQFTEVNPSYFKDNSDGFETLAVAKQEWEERYNAYQNIAQRLCRVCRIRDARIIKRTIIEEVVYEYKLS